MLEREPCPDWVERVSAYADGETDEAEEREVKAHLDQCPTCRQWLEQVRADRDVVVTSVLRQKRQRGFARGVTKQVARTRGGSREVMSWWRRYRIVHITVGSMLVVLVALVVFPVLSRDRSKARQVSSGSHLKQIFGELAKGRSASCLSNVKQICLALLMYTEDNHNLLPPHEGWTDAIFPYTRNNQILICPEDPERTLPGYDFSPALAGTDLKSIKQPATTVMVYEAKDGRPVKRHNDGLVVGYADGHVKWEKDLPAGFLEQQSLGPPTRNYGLADRLRIAYEAEEDVEVADVPVAVMQAERDISQRGGFLLDSSLTRHSERLTAQIVFRVPAEEMLATMNALAKLGAVVGRCVKGEDLTEKYVAAQSAVESEAQKQERLEKIERRTRATVEKLGLAGKIGESHAAAEQQRSEIRQVLARTVLATGTARFFERERVAPTTLLAAAERAWQSAGRSGRVVATAVIWLLAYLPFWGAALAAFLVGRHLWLRRRG